MTIGLLAGAGAALTQRWRIAAGCVVVLLGLSLAPWPVPARVEAGVGVVSVPVAPAAPLWIEIARPLEMFGWDAGDGRVAVRYDARRRAGSDAREDVISVGGIGANERVHARLEIRRAADGGMSGPLPGFTLDVVRRAAAAGIAVSRIATPDESQTKFGAVETADVLLAGQTPEHGGERACLAFRRIDGDGDLAFWGWWCPPAGHAAERAALICALDRVHLVAAGEDRRLRRLFVDAEKRRPAPCGGARGGAARATWMQGAETPRLRR